MIIQNEFKFLKLEQMQRKPKEEEKNVVKYYYVLNVLDADNNPVKFFSFNEDENAKLVTVLGSVKGLQDILIKFDLSFNNNNWNVRLLNVESQF